jgi:hypothetical protein
VGRPLPEMPVVGDSRRGTRDLSLELAKDPLYRRGAVDLASVNVPDVVALGLGFLAVFVEARDVGLVPQV